MKNDLPPACILGKALTINCKSTLPGLMDKFQTFRNCRTTIPLSFLKLLGQNIVPYGFYESPNAQLNEIGCVNYVRFPKSGHNYYYSYIIYIMCLCVSVCGHNITLLSAWYN